MKLILGGHGWLVCAGPVIVAALAIGWVILYGASWEPIAIGVGALVAAIAGGFPFGIVCTERHLVRVFGAIPWDSIIEVGYVRTTNIASDSLEKGNFVPVLRVLRRGGGSRWVALRELRSNGSDHGEVIAQRRTVQLSSYGVPQVVVPAGVEPHILW